MHTITQCERCGQEVDNGNVGDFCEESLCPLSIYQDNYEELDFSNEKADSLYIPDTIP